MSRVKPTGEPGANTIEAMAKAREAEVFALRQISVAIASLNRIKAQFPALFDGLKHELHSAIDAPPTAEHLEAQTAIPDEDPVPEDKQYGVEKLIAFFKARNNAPATIKQMAKAIGRTERTIKTILYTRHKKQFFVAELRGRNNRAFFQLAE